LEIAIKHDVRPIVKYYLEQEFGCLDDIDALNFQCAEAPRDTTAAFHMVKITALMLVSPFADDASTRYLVKKLYADVNVRDSDGETVLMRAMKADRVAEIELFVKVTRKGEIDLDIWSKEGKSLLEVMEEHPTVKAVMLKHLPNKTTKKRKFV
jgi:hypothetical protein